MQPDQPTNQSTPWLKKLVLKPVHSRQPPLNVFIPSFRLLAAAAQKQSQNQKDSSAVVVEPEDVLCNNMLAAVDKYFASSDCTHADVTLLTHQKAVIDWQQVAFAVVEHLQTGCDDTLQDIGDINRQEHTLAMLMQLSMNSGDGGMTCTDMV